VASRVALRVDGVGRVASRGAAGALFFCYDDGARTSPRSSNASVLLELAPVKLALLYTSSVALRAHIVCIRTSYE
jgi:hypothetical protein